MSSFFRFSLSVSLAICLLISRFLCVSYAADSLEKSYASITEQGPVQFSAASVSPKSSLEPFPIYEIFEENNENEEKLRKLNAYIVLSFSNFSLKGLSLEQQGGSFLCPTAASKKYISYSIMRI